MVALVDLLHTPQCMDHNHGRLRQVHQTRKPRGRPMTNEMVLLCVVVVKAGKT
jgi:hypothetical protein